MKEPTNIDIKDQQILQLLSSNCMSVKDITKKLFISEATVRRRLSRLENQNLIIRTHGGAVLNKNQHLYDDIPLYLRTMQLNTEKEKIAQKAAKHINNGDIIFIDSSSTVLYLLPFLSSYKHITVCTNSLKAAIILSEMEIPCTVFGGDVISNAQSCNSSETFEMIHQIYADLFFFSCDALSSDGILTNYSKSSCQLRRQYIKNSKKSICLIDHSKLDKQSRYILCSLKDIDLCICDIPLPETLKIFKDTDNF